jgi:hypothetical protein
MKRTRTNAEFGRRARARLRAWLRRSGYDAPGFEVEFSRSWGGGERAVRVVVRRAGEIVDVNEVRDYPSVELLEGWARGEGW